MSGFIIVVSIISIIFILLICALFISIISPLWSPFLTGRVFLRRTYSSTSYDSFLNLTFSSPNMVRRIYLFSTGLEWDASFGPNLRQTCSRQHDRKCRLKSSQVKSIHFNHPSQGNSTNDYLILGLRDKAAPPTSQQINRFPPKRVKNLATPSSIFLFSSSTGELCSQPFRGNVHRIGRMFPEHIERSFLDPEYSFEEYFQLGSRRKVRPIKNQIGSPNTSN